LNSTRGGFFTRFRAFPVEDQNDTDATRILVFGEPFDQFLPAKGGAAIVKPAELGPRKDHAMAIDEEITHGGTPMKYPEAAPRQGAVGTQKTQATGLGLGTPAPWDPGNGAAARCEYAFAAGFGHSRMGDAAAFTLRPIPASRSWPGGAGLFGGRRGHGGHGSCGRGLFRSPAGLGLGRVGGLGLDFFALDICETAAAFLNFIRLLTHKNLFCEVGQ
jgi:hypothetical protein